MARNLVFSQGLKTDIFISGAGGGLRYGAVAFDASDELGFHKPVTLAWKGREYYLGAGQNASLTGLLNASDIKYEDLSNTDLDTKIRGKLFSLKSEMKDSWRQK